MGNSGKRHSLPQRAVDQGRISQNFDNGGKEIILSLKFIHSGENPEMGM